MLLRSFIALACFVLAHSKIHSFSIQDMTLEEKIGQLLLVHFNGSTANEMSEKLLDKAHVGGVIYYEWSNSLSSFKQVQDLSASLQQMNRKYNCLPLLIAIDQEGGMVSRLKNDFTLFPSSSEIGRLEIPSLTYHIATAMGRELKLAGINMNLAPVADIVKNPTSSIIGSRSFGSSAANVTEHVRAALEGYKEAKVIAVVKHFPGLGDISVDPHYDSPIAKKTIEQLSSCELQPFKALREKIEALMTSHCIIEGIDPFRTVSTSPVFIKDLLRTSWCYDGLIITDSLAMKGVSYTNDPLEKTVLKALLAGNDLICLGGKLLNEKSSNEITPADVLKIHAALVQYVQRGDISENEINQKVERIIRLKQKYCYDISPTSKNDYSIFERNKQLSQEIALLLKASHIDSITAKKIALKVWHNETGSSKDKLIHWNNNEDFISLGIGHFIWYPKERKSHFEEGFPHLVEFIKKENVSIPSWIEKAPFCPWEDKTCFLENINSKEMQELRIFLEETMDIQGKYIILKACRVLHEIITSLSLEIELDKILKVLSDLTSTPNGLYALIDYINFKGSGLSISERYNGKGWGLLQALQKLCDYPSAVSMQDFCIVTKKLLEERVVNSQSPEKEGKWLLGWCRRIDTYEKDL